jgi:hypothetical protein
MARQRFDIGSKWLLHHQSKGILQVGGLTNVRRCEPMPGEVIQNRRFPDGLMRVFFGNDAKHHHVLLEIATYPERRALKQAMDDLMLAYSALGHLPELRMLVLPWGPLMNITGPVELILERCAERIQREAQPKDRTDMLVISQVMAEIRFPGLDLLTIFGGKNAMIESPFFQRVEAETIRKVILYALKKRFGSTPRDVTNPLRDITDEKKLCELNIVASSCADLDEFRKALLE